MVSAFFYKIYAGFYNLTLYHSPPRPRRRPLQGDARPRTAFQQAAMIWVHYAKARGRLDVSVSYDFPLDREEEFRAYIARSVPCPGRLLACSWCL